MRPQVILGPQRLKKQILVMKHMPQQLQYLQNSWFNYRLGQWFLVMFWHQNLLYFLDVLIAFIASHPRWVSMPFLWNCLCVLILGFFRFFLFLWWDQILEVSSDEVFIELFNLWVNFGLPVKHLLGENLRRLRHKEEAIVLVSVKILIFIEHSAAKLKVKQVLKMVAQTELMLVFGYDPIHWFH